MKIDDVRITLDILSKRGVLDQDEAKNCIKQVDKLEKKAIWTGLLDDNSDELLLGAQVRFISGDIGKIVFEAGAYGIAFKNAIDYEELQEDMDRLEQCCGNDYDGCFNDNFISLWEIYWNFNCEDNMLYPVEIYVNEDSEQIDKKEAE